MDCLRLLMKRDSLAVHGLSKKQIYSKALALREQGRLFNPKNAGHADTFKGSVDRFCEIAYRLRHSKKVLDVGAGSGILLFLLAELGHECYGADVYTTAETAEVYTAKGIRSITCNIEADSLPFPDCFFDAVVCCQALEHFTHSHLGPVKEMGRVLRAGGIIEADVPNAVCFHNRSRIIRGKHITWDYKQHYLYAKPVIYKGLSFYPDRHNREFTRDELHLLFDECGFKNVDVYFLKSRRHRVGLEKVKSLGSALRDLVPSLRKTLIAFAEKGG